MGELVGRNLGPYRVLEQVGAGGMATVYKAYHAAMDRYVAIKVLPQHLARDANFRARFQREARTIARLEHRYILPVHDVGEADDIPYFVMRYTEGGDLNGLIASKTLTITRIATIISQVAEALAHAHRQGIIHRDVKPANILISAEGDPLLTDFGIAKIYEETLQLTSDGMMVGTPTYMAPEQLQGQPVDARTDVYALGVVLYQALTGEPPFVAETPLAVMLMHIHNPLRPPRQLVPALPESIERIILRAMAKDPKDRYQTASEMAEALREALAGMSRSTAMLVQVPSEPPAPEPLVVIEPPPAPETPPSPPTRGIRGPRWLWLGAGAALLAALALVAFFFQPGSGGGGNQPTPLPASVVAGPTAVPRANLKVLTNASVVFDLATLGDAVWAATSGGLVRYSADGSTRGFSVADGLPFNATTAISAGPDGLLYLGGTNGVARIRPAGDGLGEVSSYGQQQGVDIGQVFAFMTDSDGSVWLGGDNGLRRFDGQTWAAPALPLDDPTVGEVRAVYTMLRDTSGTLWIGVEGGILRWDGQSWTRFGEEQGLGQGLILRLLEAKDGTIWAAGGGLGLLRFDTAQGSWQKVPVSHDGEDVRSISQLADGRLWVSNDAGIFQLAADGASWETITPPPDYPGWPGLGRMAEDGAGKVWVGAGAGVSCCANASWQLQELPSGLPFVRVGKLAVAPDGKLWAVEEYGGVVAVVDPATQAFETLALPDSRISAVAFSQDTQWLGSSDGLIRQRSGVQLRLSTDDGLPSNEIRSLLVSETTLWVGTSSGLVSYDLASESFSEPVPEFDGQVIATLFGAPDGAIWAGSRVESDDDQTLLGRYDGAAWEIWDKGDQPVPESSGGVTAIGADAQRRIWVAVLSGGVHIWEGGAQQDWSEAGSPPRGLIYAIVQQGEALWMGGEGDDLSNTLYQWSQAGWKPLPLDGLSGYVTAMQFTADGALWLATGDGLLRLDPAGVAALAKP